MPRTTPFDILAFLLGTLMWSGCSDPHSLGGSSGMLSTSTSSTTGPDDGADETAADETAGTEDIGGGGGGGGGFPCEMQGMFDSYTSDIPDIANSEEFAPNVRPSIVCDFPELVDPDGLDDDRLSTDLDDDAEEVFDILVYRPRDASGDWPTTQTPHPAVFLAPGRGLETVGPDLADPDDHYYYPLIEPLVEAGFVVFAIEPSSVDWGSGKRRAALACAMMWAKDSTNGWVAADDDRIGESAILLGHSRGGTAAVRLTKSLLCQSSSDPVADGCCLAPDPCPAKDDLPAGTALDTYEICSTVAIAPRWNEGANDAPVIRTTDAPPFLMIQGTLDEDTLGQGIPSYDTNVDEDLAVASDPSTLRKHDKVGLWVYGPMHKTWGGDDPITAGGLIGLDQARATGPHFVEQFLRWQLFRETAARDRVLAPAKSSPIEADFDATVWDPSLWTPVTSPTIAEYYEGDGVSLAGTGRPLVYTSFTQGTLWPGAGRFVVDTLARGTVADDCDGDISPSTMGTTISFSPLGAGNADVCQGPADQIDPVPGNLVGSDHETEALAVAWGGPNAGVQAEWHLGDGSGPLGAVADYTHLTLRVGNPVESCPPVLDEFQLEIELESEGQDGSPVTATVTTGVIPDQHGEFVAGSTGFPVCPISHFMHTIRIPLTEFCDQELGFDPSTLNAVRVRFPGSPEFHRALVDSIEFTRDPDDMAPQACPQSRTDWNCVASGTLVATETSCGAEPTPTCNAGAVVTTALALPWVDDGAGGGHSGWVVHVPRGWVDDPSAPTLTELDGIVDECIAACELEWSDDPDVSANCAAAGAFTVPTLRNMNGLGPVHMIPTDREQGAGLFAAEELDCNLEGDCCLEFDEDICAARSTRSTAAREALQRGEEIRVNIGTSASKATFISPSGSVSTPVLGSAGYSLCADDSTTCPFYVGSLSLTATNAITVTDTCADSSPFSAVVTDLDIELLQPAFGIQAYGTLQQALPEGSLHLLGYISVNGMDYSVRAINEDPVFLTAGPGGFFAGDLAVMLDAPCGGSTLPITLLIELRSAGTPSARPPTIEITTPTQVSCPGALVLHHDASDPDGDLASVRWYVDDVLISSAISTLPFTTSHVLRAVARDSRGATTAATKTVTCE